MSNYGLLLKTGNQEVLIDNDSPHPRLIHTATVTLPASSVGRAFTVTIPTPTTRPIFATGFSETAFFQFQQVVFNGTYYSGVVGIAGSGSSGETIVVRVYEV